MAKTDKVQQTVVDGKTGEIAGLLADEGGRSEADTFDAMALLNANKGLIAKAKAAATAKPEAFRDTEKDFWKPEEVNEEIRGVYLATKPGAKYKVHFIGREDPSTGRPTVVRINGSTVLTREMSKVEPGQAVRIVYKGETKSEAGNKVSLFSVTVLAE